MHVIVLGAGLAGLSCAYELAKAGHRVTVLEKDEHVGGMATSYRVGDFTVDHGPHRFHTRDKELLAHIHEVMDNDLVVRNRLSRIYLRGKFFHYPLQAGNVLRNLPPHLLAKAFLDYLAVRIRNRFRPIPDSNFENWVTKRFGKTLYELFFGTYTEKAWHMPCSQISADWASQRITLLNLWDTVKKTLRPPKGGEVRTLVSRFWYPREGGIGSLGTHYADKLRAMGCEVLVHTPAEKLLRDETHITGVVFRRNGERVTERPDYIVSTIPLQRMIEAMDPEAPEDVRASIARLRHLSIVFVYLEVGRPSVTPDHWVYLPEKHLKVHRISEFKNFSEETGPRDKTVICAEMTCVPGDETWNLSLEEASAIAARDLQTIGILRPGEGKGVFLARVRYAYPVYDLTYKENLERLKRFVKPFENLDTTGRQGLYRYNNMDHSIAMGRKVARGLIRGVDAGAHAVATGEEYFG
ncbi:MAG TPA: FAD-dependent oxidoreductase [Planctomycetota bacterium]|nr:FAD-dependent oxidoreductase [Planctomycetota bacterium]